MFFFFCFPLVLFVFSPVSVFFYLLSKVRQRDKGDLIKPIEQRQAKTIATEFIFVPWFYPPRPIGNDIITHTHTHTFFPFFSICYFVLCWKDSIDWREGSIGHSHVLCTMYLLLYLLASSEFLRLGFFHK